MAVDPLARSTTPPRPEAQRTELAQASAAASNAATNQGAPETVLAADIVAISSDALQTSRGEGIPAGEVTAEMLQDIGQKLADGAYDSPEGQHILSDLILRQIQLPVAWGGLV